MARQYPSELSVALKEVVVLYAVYSKFFLDSFNLCLKSTSDISVIDMS
jgi:hypothetical protein